MSQTTPSNLMPSLMRSFAIRHYVNLHNITRQIYLGDWSSTAYALADGIQRLLTRHGRWDAKLDLKKVLEKPSSQLEFAFADGSG